MKIAAGSVWARRNAPDLRLVVDGKLLWQVKFTYTVSGIRGVTTTRKLRQQYTQVG